MSDEPSYLQKLDALVEKIMDAAVADGVTISQRLDALKICSQHYVNTERLKGKKDPDAAPAGDTMDGFRNRISNPATQIQEPEEEDEPS